MISNNNMIVILMLMFIMLSYYQCNGFVSSSLKSSTSTLNRKIINRISSTESSTISSTTETPTIDLTGYTAFIRFDGFDVRNMTALLSFSGGNQCSYSGGIDQSEPGFWRVTESESGTVTVEATHQVLPEYMFFYDTEKTILWKGTLDMKSKRIINGQVTTNKKRFGLFAYEQELAKFEANLIEPGENVPIIDIPTLSEVPILPPDDFLTPFDMKLHPEIFDPEYVDWFFETEEKLALSQTPLPPRPRPFWVPRSNKLDAAAKEKVENENSSSKGKKELRQKEDKGGKGKGF